MQEPLALSAQMVQIVFLELQLLLAAAVEAHIMQQLGSVVPVAVEEQLIQVLEVPELNTIMVALAVQVLLTMVEVEAVAQE